jgi:DNA replication and repair protein RecF
MKLKAIQLDNFRCFTQKYIDFSGSPFILKDKNGTGKTSVLEAISVLSILKSFRSTNLNPLIKHGADYFRITAKFDNPNGEEERWEMFYTLSPKRTFQVKVNNVKATLKSMLGRFFTVVFEPADLNLFYLSPKNRRHFLDVLLCQYDIDYLIHLSNLKKLIPNRNKLLKLIQENLASKEEMFYWDQKLLECGSYIMHKRHILLQELEPIVKDQYYKIADKEISLSIKYKSSFELPKEDLSLEEIKTLFSNHLEEIIEKEIHRGESILGPHRDDFYVYYNDVEVKDICSRGEMRTVILALKIAQLEKLASLGTSTPLFLLDDVFSELDHSRNQGLLSVLDKYPSIVTTVETKELSLETHQIDEDII